MNSIAKPPDKPNVTTILVEYSNFYQLFRIFVLHVTFSLQRYFSGSEGYTKHQYTFWHGKHAGFFEGSEDYDRKSEVALSIRTADTQLCVFYYHRT